MPKPLVLMMSSPATAAGPIPRLAARLGRGLQSRGWEVSALPWGSGAAGPRVRTRVAQVLAAARFARVHQPDVVLLHSAHDWRANLRDIALLMVMRSMRVKTALMFHGSLADDFAPSLRQPATVALWLAARLSSALCVLSRAEERRWIRLGLNRPIAVVRNAFDPCPPSGARQRVLHHPTRLLFVGRILKQKGIFECIAATSQVAKHLDVELAIVGAGPAANSAARLAEELGLGSKVRFLGRLPHCRLDQIFSSSDILLLPSAREGFPTVLLEAMNAGLGIVTTPVGGVPDELEEGVNALFVPPGDAASLASSLRRLIEDANLYERMTQANLATIHDYRPELVAVKYSRILHLLAGDQTFD